MVINSYSVARTFLRYFFMQKNKKINPNSQRIVITLNSQLIDILDKIRSEYGLSRSSVITTLIAKYARSEYGIKAEND